MQTRQLAAIMFADMTGYTAMMQDNEQKARILRERQKQILETLIPAYNGKILQYFGDGTLSLFDSAINAVRSAIEIQNELPEAIAMLPNCADMIAQLIDREITLDEIPEAYARIATGKADGLKTLIRINASE